MREIKFRAWDKKDKRMIVDKQDCIPLIVTNKSVFKLDPTSEKHRWIEINTNRFELMQSTGLKDKNGKEIYEGDIVKTTSNELIGKFKHKIYKIEFKEINCVAGAKYIGFDFQFNVDEIEVIGNIYENPELLESK